MNYRSIRDAVWACRHIGANAKIVALRLVEHWPRIMPSIASLAEFTGLSESTVQRSLRELESARVIATRLRNGSRSEYAFVGVSIPDLGECNPSQADTPTPVRLTPHPSQADTPTPVRLTPEADNLKQTRKREREAGAERAPEPVCVAKTYTMPSKDPPQAYLDEARMGGVSREQAVSTWSHYYGAGLPTNGIERLHWWLTQRAAERATQMAKVERVRPGGRDTPNQPNAGVTGLEKAKVVR